MKTIRFLIRCEDKNTGEIYEADTAREFNNKRAEEIVKTGYAEYVEAEDDSNNERK